MHLSVLSTLLIISCGNIARSFDANGAGAGEPRVSKQRRGCTADRTAEAGRALGRGRRNGAARVRSGDDVERLVDLAPNRGAVVTDLSIEEMLDLLRVYSSLEGLGAQMACERARTTDVAAQLQRA